MNYVTGPGQAAGQVLPLSTGVPGVLGQSDVVIVDDTPANVTLLERVLRTAGVGLVRGFTDPRAAVAACTSAPPDLVLLDLHMPHLDGIAVMDALGDALPDRAFLPVVVLTADITGEARQRALAAGAKDFLAKPFDHTEVVLRVRNMLETVALYTRLERHNAELQAALDAQAAAERAAAAAHQRRGRRIDDVLAGDALTMLFQPIADLATGATVGAEALARFAQEPRRPPNEWFAEATETGRGVDLELAAIAAALAQLDRLPPGAFLSINASADTACTPALAAMLASARGQRIVLELTEHARIEDYDPVLGALDRLRRQGVRIAVDDTGAGYAGLQHILRIRPDILKLDTSLTHGIDHDPIRRSLAGALVTFAREVGAVIIAEGVEVAGELDVLRTLGVPWAQGYHLARPGPLPLPSHLDSLA